MKRIPYKLKKKKLKGGGFSWGEGNGQGIAGMGSDLLGTAGDIANANSTEPSMFGSIASNAGKYASMGAVGGIPGAIIGGAVGIGMGIWQGNEDQEAFEKEQTDKANADKFLAQNYSQGIQESFGYNKGTGVTSMEKGGVIPYPFQKKGDITTFDSTIQLAHGGYMKPISDTTIEVIGNDPNAVDAVSLNKEVDVNHGETVEKIGMKQGGEMEAERVYTDEFGVDGKKATKKNPSFADIHKELQKQKNPDEERYADFNAFIDKKSDKHFQLQESLKGADNEPVMMAEMGGYTDMNTLSAEHMRANLTKRKGKKRGYLNGGDPNPSDSTKTASVVPNLSGGSGATTMVSEEQMAAAATKREQMLQGMSPEERSTFLEQDAAFNANPLGSLFNSAASGIGSGLSYLGDKAVEGLEYINEGVGDMLSPSYGEMQNTEGIGVEGMSPTIPNIDLSGDRPLNSKNTYRKSTMAMGGKIGYEGGGTTNPYTEMLKRKQMAQSIVNQDNEIPFYNLDERDSETGMPIDSPRNIFGSGAVKGKEGFYIDRDGREFSYIIAPPSKMNRKGAPLSSVDAYSKAIAAENPGADRGKEGYYGDRMEMANRKYSDTATLEDQGEMFSMTPHTPDVPEEGGRKGFDWDKFKGIGEYGADIAGMFTKLPDPEANFINNPQFFLENDKQQQDMITREARALDKSIAQNTAQSGSAAASRGNVLSKKLSASNQSKDNLYRTNRGLRRDFNDKLIQVEATNVGIRNKLSEDQVSKDIAQKQIRRGSLVNMQDRFTANNRFKDSENTKLKIASIYADAQSNSGARTKTAQEEKGNLITRKYGGLIRKKRKARMA